MRVLFAFLLTSCAARMPVSELPTADNIAARPGERCGISLHGLNVYARGVECPDLVAVEYETQFLIDLTNATHDTFAGTRAIFADQQFACGDKWATGCAWGDVVVVVKHAGWRRTLRHELEHRRREILRVLGMPPPDGYGPDWYNGHEPLGWWSLVERGKP